MNLLQNLRQKPLTVEANVKTRSDIIADYRSAIESYRERLPEWNERVADAQARAEAAKKALAEASTDISRTQVERSSAHHQIDVLERQVRASADPRIMTFHRELANEANNQTSGPKVIDEAQWQMGMDAIKTAMAAALDLQILDLSDTELTARLDALASEVMAAMGAS